MDGIVCKLTGVNFFLFILATSGGFRLALTETKSLPYNVTKFANNNVSMECRSESMNSTNQPSWFKYDNGTIIVIYDASSSSNSNSSKYTVETGNRILTVMNVQLSDAATYCCNVGGFDYYCANIVVIGYYSTFVTPSDLVRIGDTVNLTCSVAYNSPTNDRDAPFPLSDDQGPNLSARIGKDEVSRQQVVDVAAVPHTKSIIINKTVEVADLDRNFECRLHSTESGWNIVTRVQIARLGIDIIYPKRDWSYDAYKVNDVFECVSKRFPFLNVTWKDVTTPGPPRIISTGIGNARAKIFAPGKYVWKCTVASPLNTTTVSGEVGFTGLGSAGEKVTRPILLTAACMLFISLIVF